MEPNEKTPLLTAYNVKKSVSGNHYELMGAVPKQLVQKNIGSGLKISYQKEKPKSNIKKIENGVSLGVQVLKYNGKENCKKNVCASQNQQKIQVTAKEVDFGYDDFTTEVLEVETHVPCGVPRSERNIQDRGQAKIVKEQFGGKPQIVKSLVTDAVKLKLTEEQAPQETGAKKLEGSIESRLDDVVKCLKVITLTTTDNLNLTKVVARRVAVCSAQEVKQKIPFSFPLENVHNITELEEWIKQDEQNYNLYVSFFVLFLLTCTYIFS